MAHAAVNGVRVRYDESGAGPALLLSHGFSATGRMWDDQRRAFADRWRVIAWDMRGHGDTESPDDPARYSADLTVGDMRALLVHLGIRRAVIGGLSLGGYMSLFFHAQHPEMTRALVLCDTGPGYRNAEARAGWNDRAFRRASELETRGLEVLASASREMREAMRQHRSAKWLAHAARGMLAQDGARVIDSLSTVRVPTLVIVGDQDEPFLAPCRYMAGKIPGARLEIIRGAGHSANLDQPEAFNRVLGDFLDSLPAEPA
ncbi:MAG TPA: alpha/beta fold hydrolase [Methylomirabilota bacterium]|nr:alpha/beta fold hydrolase [Methylomirabilota bacterium]